ncbi:helix-turn-helix transcriptional regulator [Pedobacter gandavensis]|uniref:helix-turn-helix domain-containing protein n=1 Tax=Pedobacter gandavensis TaxID=2679963 RepID=UPI0024796506|nr:helix-turn-helix transcriptional regulator [Pedobacter gandavensis]WGQ09106.1 helix-turn-helix transcriptional regulator [Pedobacter gandavensis]
MTTETAKEKATEIFNNDIAKRLYEFRTLYVDKSQRQAAKKLGITNAWLSYAESGQRRVRMDLVEKLVKDYDLNSDWLTTGKGKKQVKTIDKPTAASSLSSVHQEVLLIKKTLTIFEANLTHAYKLIETQGKVIEELQRQLAEK